MSERPADAAEEAEERSAILPWELLKAVAPVLLLTLLVLVVGYKFIDPAPPKKIVIATSAGEGNYLAFSYLYAELLKREGITLEVRQTAGAQENLKLLRDPKSGVDLAFIQGGVASSEPTLGMVSLGSLYYEPVWIFCKCAKPPEHLSAFKGKRIGIGRPGGGAQVVARAMLEASGVTADNSHFEPIGDDDAAEALHAGRLDAAFFLDVPHSPLVQELALDHKLRLVDVTEAEAYTRNIPSLTHLHLPAGGLSLARNLPDNETNLVAPTVMLVARDSLHPALMYLLLKTIASVHGGGGLFSQPHDFPSAKGTDFVLADQAANFYKSGLPFLDKYLPFWAATFVNRMLILLLPLLAVVYPLSKVVPSVYVWLVKSKIYKLYGELRYLETQIRQGKAANDHLRNLATLDEIEAKVNQLRLPNAFSQHMYELRAHIAMVRGQIRSQEQFPNH
ncbi:TAXI family TRAP transporter solute-binding subunit [Ferriphaselus sp. R-1]|uniref:TAXI family TRAP transporter solute-binding subunit n=1 Tax=Ferriphaselus sp. R-1 TaxID=1485544 RepID=UPI00068EFA6E|nr:TAXI family TRAP transporter solute-binding subunit [Ferriphaselus sp. R-1]